MIATLEAVHREVVDAPADFGRYFAVLTRLLDAEFGADAWSFSDDDHFAFEAGAFVTIDIQATEATYDELSRRAAQVSVRLHDLEPEYGTRTLLLAVTP